MVPLTTGFTQEMPLHPAAKSLIGELFSKGWADPAKVHRASRELSILVNKAKATFAEQFNVELSQLEFLGEPDLGFQLGIAGMIGEQTTQTKQLNIAHSQIDRQPVHAITRELASLGHNVEILPVDQAGQIEVGKSKPEVLIWQVANGETGNFQVKHPSAASRVFLDCTTSGIDIEIPKDYEVALFDSTAWSGPTGLGIMVIKNANNWRYPLAHIDAIRSPRTFSIPLLIASAVALENYATDLKKNTENAKKLSEIFLHNLKNGIPDLQIASNLINRQFKYLSLIIPGIDGEQLKNELAESGVDIDSGSACKSADLRPSHVLAAMGFETTGNIRVTFKPEHTSKDVTELSEAIINKTKTLRI